MNSPVWMPYTQMKDAPSPLMVRSAHGAVLELEDGRQLLDCISSWWVTLHGHTQPQIAAAIADQAQRLEQVIAAGFTHQPAEDLARRLRGHLPFVPRLFYSDNGSTAVEVALKMAYQYWRNRGAQGRRRFLSLEGAYHGDTLGAMSLSGRSLFTAPFAELLLPVDWVPFPQTWIGDGEAESREAAALEHLDGLLRRGGEEYAAMIVEPLVQGAAGMRMCRPHFLRQLAGLLRRHGVLLIADEVFTGFGRTGEFFACQKAEIQPDILCLAKGLSGGFLPLAATLCSEEVYQAFCSEDPHHTFYHGHSYTANPLGCAAALASLELLEQQPAPFAALERWHREELGRLADHPQLCRLRVCGTIAALEVKGAEGYLHELGPSLKARFLERGFLLRPLGGVIYLVPPYCLERGQLEAVYRCIAEVVAACSS
ncbi:MAG: adenosylmethionine--8-amino-7-oxononanoate transaminase [Candidatus Latescibacteria bacterium]|nr:adenosylmethionine--8-amino-7-oxononanoate transaminase [Candidatus Latescibacterota bacterium]